jgi:hypothetical protein
VTRPLGSQGTQFTTGRSARPPPVGYEDFTSYPGFALTGSLEGCLYTKVITTKETPGGVYLESGEEVFVGSLDGQPVGTFATTYRFESKWDPDVSTGVEVHGRCQHPIVEGSGTGGFEGAKGRLDFKDIIGDPVTLRLPGSYQPHIADRCSLVPYQLPDARHVTDTKSPGRSSHGPVSTPPTARDSSRCRT